MNDCASMFKKLLFVSFLATSSFVSAMEPDELFSAVTAGCVQDVKAMLDVGANVNQRYKFYWDRTIYEQYTLLHGAVREKNKAMVELLLSKGAGINAGFIFIDGCLDVRKVTYEKWGDRLEPVKDTISYRWENRTVLHEAVRTSNLEIVKLLLNDPKIDMYAECTCAEFRLEMQYPINCPAYCTGRTSAQRPGQTAFELVVSYRDLDKKIDSVRT